jgi:hypothetical protein
MAAITSGWRMGEPSGACTDTIKPEASNLGGVLETGPGALVVGVLGTGLGWCIETRR